MKRTLPFLFSLALVLLFSACKSEEERRMARMVDSLDSAWAIHEPPIAAFFSSVDAMKASMKPVTVPGAGQDSLLTGEAATVWAQLRWQSYGGAVPGPGGPLKTSPPLVVGQNACALLYDDSLWNAHPMAFFRTWEGLPALHLDHLHTRLREDRWSDLFDEERQISIDGDDRDDFLRKGLRLMPLLGEMRYLLVMQTVFFVPGKDLGGVFEPGAALARVQLWDVREKKFSGHFWIKAVNSGSVFTLQFENQNEADAVNAELLRDLERNLYHDLNGSLPEMVQGARWEVEEWE